MQLPRQYDRVRVRAAGQAVAPPPAPTVLDPADGATVTAGTVTLKFAPPTGATRFLVVVTKTPAGTTNFLDDATAMGATQRAPGVWGVDVTLPATDYYWSVRAAIGDGDWGAASPTQLLHVAPVATTPPPTADSDAAACEGKLATFIASNPGMTVSVGGVPTLTVSGRAEFLRNYGGSVACAARMASYVAAPDPVPGANLPATTTPATPATTAAPANPAGIPWWGWALIGAGGLYIVSTLVPRSTPRTSHSGPSRSRRSSR